MRDKFADVIYKIGKKNKKIAVLVADISPAGSISDFKNQFPERFINTGVAEQSMIGIAGGMALQGLRPFCYTISTFALYRPEDIKAYQDRGGLSLYESPLLSTTEELIKKLKEDK